MFIWTCHMWEEAATRLMCLRMWWIPPKYFKDWTEYEDRIEYKDWRVVYKNNQK